MSGQQQLEHSSGSPDRTGEHQPFKQRDIHLEFFAEIVVRGGRLQLLVVADCHSGLKTVSQIEVKVKH